MKSHIKLVLVCLLLTALVSPIFIQDLGYSFGLTLAGLMFVVLSFFSVGMFNYLESGNIFSAKSPLETLWKSEIVDTHSHKVIMLRSENLTNLGKSMGSEFTTTNYAKPFLSVDSAKAFAEKEYGKPIQWITEPDEIRSPDLLWVMYHIEHKMKE